MQAIEVVNFTANLDPWFSLVALSRYSGLSIRSLRDHLSDSHRPIPHYRMKEPHIVRTKDGKPRTVTGKILVRRSDFDRWMEHFKYTPDLDKLVDEVVSEIR